ncbi:MAG TPA: hypothetical protein VGD84_00300, partial [Pseudonocardiaceae bacterium]
MFTPTGTDIPTSPSAPPFSRGAFRATCPHGPSAQVTPIGADTSMTGAAAPSAAAAMLKMPFADV